MTEKEQALAYLGRDPVLNISMTEPLRLGRAHVAARSNRGVVLEMDGIAMVAAETPDEALRLLEAVPEANTWNVTVSYTHLDVYKRQRHYRKRDCVLILECNVPGLGPGVTDSRISNF